MISAIEHWLVCLMIEENWVSEENPPGILTYLAQTTRKEDPAPVSQINDETTDRQTNKNPSWCAMAVTPCAFPRIPLA
jgi:hypothetical protein